jgi:hypothetical protein
MMSIASDLWRSRSIAAQPGKVPPTLAIVKVLENNLAPRAGGFGATDTMTRRARRQQALGFDTLPGGRRSASP